VLSEGREKVMAEVRPPSVRSVKAALWNAGLAEAATQGSGRMARVVRGGWHAWSLGGEVRVTHWSVLTLSRPAERAELARYAPALKAAGWKVIEDIRGGLLAVLAMPAKEGGSND
jgi:hypothetical protein